MDSSSAAHHLQRRTQTGKRLMKHPSLGVDSPLYDASEEDNDGMTDDASSARGVLKAKSKSDGTRGSLLASSTTDPALPAIVLADGSRHGQNIASTQGVTSQLANSSLQDSEAMDSETYDGDIESSTTAAPAPSSTPPARVIAHAQADSITSLDSRRLSSDSTSSSHFINPNDNARIRAELGAFGGFPHVGFPKEAPPSDQITKPKDMPTVASTEDIRSFVQAAIDGTGKIKRTYKPNPPPKGRPARVYADGVYDIFHFGHSLQLRQAKLSFPDVHLMVGVCSDELCVEHKSRTVMNHAERCESVRHCRWVDEILPDAPWIIDQAFIDKHEIDYIAHDEDPYPGIDGSADVYEFAKSSGHFIPTRRTSGVSTSELLERIVAGYRDGDWDKKLIKGGHPELASRAPSREASRPGSSMGHTGHPQTLTVDQAR